jgi:Glutamine amidotransferases class-II
MCKLFIVTGALPSAGVRQVLAAVNKRFAKTERDGFGFIATTSGRYARGRYFEPDRFRGFELGLPPKLTGDISEENHIPYHTRTLIVHGRTATSTQNLVNCHPFMRGSEALAHNGVVDWIGPDEDCPAPECDSEQFLHWLQDSGHAWNEARRAFSGWGAIAHVDVQTGVLTVARDRAMLYVARRARAAGWVLATKKEHLMEVCSAAGIKLQHEPLLLPDKKLLLFNWRGAVTAVEDWSGFGPRRFTGRDRRSWGNSGDNEDYERLDQIPGSKRKSHRRGKSRRKDGGGTPSLWGSGDLGGDEYGETFI